MQHTHITSNEAIADVLHALDLLDEGFAVFDPDLKMVVSNIRFHEFLGYPIELREPGTCFNDLVRFRAERGDFGAGTVDAHVEDWRARARRLGSQSYEQARDHGTVVVERFFPLSKRNLLIAVADVTAMEQLRRAEDKIRQLARLPEENPGPVLRFGPDDVLVYANQAAQPLLAHARRIVGDLAPEEWRAMFTEVRDKGAPIEREFERDGAAYSLQLCPVESTGGVNMYGRDVTVWRQAEVELRRAKEAADAANQTKSQFLANMSHELRTPMNAIIGFTRLVMRKSRDALEPKQFANLEKILVSADHLLTLINNVLDLSKVEAGKMDVVPESFDLQDVVVECLKTVEPMVREGVKLGCETQAAVPMTTDRGKLKQVLFNLLSNAVKFTKEGSVMVVVEREGDRVRVGVKDTGIGIPAEALASLFQEFQQVDATTTREYGGTGLGLAICRKIAKLLKGDVTAESEPGKGSTFTLELPLAYREAPAVDRPETERRGLDSKAPTDGPLVLVIDDDDNTVDLLRQDLSEAGYRVADASNGVEGIERARELSPAAIVLDVMMSAKDGWQVLHELKSDDATREIPVIMLSVVDQRPLGYRLGASDYLLKPIHREALLEAVGRLVPARGRLLVIDDDPNVHDLVTQILEDQPVELLSARDGREGLAMMREHQPDAVFLDLMMPELDGFGVLDAVRDDPRLAQIPIMVLTAKTLSESERALLGERAKTVLRKQGLDRDALVREVRAALSTREGA